MGLLRRTGGDPDMKPRGDAAVARVSGMPAPGNPAGYLAVTASSTYCTRTRGRTLEEIVFSLF